MCVPASLAAIAAATGHSKQAVSGWRSGDKKPGPEARAKLDAKYGIPAGSWGQRPQERADNAPKSARRSAPPGAAGEDADPPSPTTMEGVEALLKRIRDALNRPGMLASEQVKLVDSETKLLSLRHRLEKEAELLEDRIVKQHPMWARIKAAIGDTLVGWPEAARAVAAKLRELEG